MINSKAMKNESVIATADMMRYEVKYSINKMKLLQSQAPVVTVMDKDHMNILVSD